LLGLKRILKISIRYFGDEGFDVQKSRLVEVAGAAAEEPFTPFLIQQQEEAKE
jgi:hypothetical protein